MFRKEGSYHLPYHHPNLDPVQFHARGCKWVAGYEQFTLHCPSYGLVAPKESTEEDSGLLQRSHNIRFWNIPG